jgi:hypothetical protein
MRSMSAHRYNGCYAYVFSAFWLLVVFNLPPAPAAVNWSSP